MERRFQVVRPIVLLFVACGGAPSSGGLDRDSTGTVEPTETTAGSDLDAPQHPDAANFDDDQPTPAPDSLLPDHVLSDQTASEDVLTRPQNAPAFDPDGGDFWDLPFPTDARRSADGRLDLSGFPNPEGVPMLEYLLGLVETSVDGWSVAPVLYFRFQTALDRTVLPEPYIPADPEAPVQLLDLTPGPTYGDRIPLQWRYREEPGVYLREHTLMLRPVWGFPLAEGHTYAAVLLDSLRDASGRPYVRPTGFQQALDGTLQGHDSLVASLAPLRARLADDPALAKRVLVATAFTVGHPTQDLRRIRDFLYQETEPPQVLDIENKTKPTDLAFSRYEGHYIAPNFLEGDPPYLDGAGGFVFDESGRPVVQTWEKMRFVLIVPKKVEMPASGWPIVIHSHGTGGQYDSHVKNPGTYLAEEGLAGIGIDQPLHGDRVQPPLSDQELELYSFNFVNLTAGRTVQRQSVPDNISLLRMIRAGNLRVPKEVSTAGREERFDPNGVVFFGHSQGGITGGMLFGVEDRFRGGLLSGAGAGLSLTLMLRKDFVDIAELVRGFFAMDEPTELSEDHPVVSLFQMLFDATDPVAYASHYFEYDPTGAAAGPRHVMITEGLLDQQTPPATTETLAACVGVPVLLPLVHQPLGLSVKGIGPVPAPVHENIVLPDGRRVTGFLAQFPDQDHFAVFDDPDARAEYREFLRTLAVEGSGRVGFHPASR